MPTVTVQGGGNSVLALQYTSNDVVAVADQLARQITAAVRTGTLPLTYYNGVAPTSGVLAVSSVGNSISLQPGNTRVIVNSGPAGYGAAQANTIFGAANTSGLQLLADSGGLNFYGGQNATGTVVAGDGANFLATAGTGGGGFAFASGAGNDTVCATAGNNTVSAGTGQNLVFMGSGNNVVFASGQDTICGNAGTDPSSRGTDSISVNGPYGVTVWSANSNINFVNGTGYSTVYGGYGSETIDAGVGGGVFYAGLAGNSHLSANGGTAFLYGTADGDVLTVTGDHSNVLTAGAGNETLNGANATGLNTYVAGSGNTVISAGPNTDIIYGGPGHATMDGGLGQTVYVFWNGTRGVNTIYGFTPGKGDGLYLPGFYQAAERDHAVATQTHAGGNTTLTLSDNTIITFVNVASISPQNFWIG